MPNNSEVAIKIKIDTDTKAIKITQDGFESLTKTVADSDKATSNFTDTLTNIAHAGQAIVGLKMAWDGVNNALDSTIGRGLRVNESFESMGLGIAAVIASSSKDINSAGQDLTIGQKVAESIAEAQDAMTALKKENRETIATLPELTEAFQSALAPARALGMSTTQVVVLTKDMANAAAAIGMPMNQLSQEIRAVLEGDTSRNSRVNQILQIKEETIKAHAAAGDLAQFLQQKLKDYAAFGDLLGSTMKGVKSNIQDDLDQSLAAATNGIFEHNKTSLMAFEKYLSEHGKDIGEGLASAINSVIPSFELLKNTGEAAGVIGIGAIALKAVELRKSLIEADAAEAALLVTQKEAQAISAAEAVALNSRNAGLFATSTAFKEIEVATNSATVATGRFGIAIAAIEAHPLIALAIAGTGLFFSVKYAIEKVQSNKEAIDQQREDYLQSNEYMLKSEREFGEQYNKLANDLANKQRAYSLIANNPNPLIKTQADKLKQEAENLKKELADTQASLDGIAYKLNSSAALVATPAVKDDKKAQKLADDWAKYKITLNEKITQSESDESIRAYAQLDKQYTLDLAKYSKVAGSKALIDEAYHAQLDKLNETTVAKFNEKQSKVTTEYTKLSDELTNKTNELTAKAITDPMEKEVAEYNASVTKARDAFDASKAKFLTDATKAGFDSSAIDTMNTGLISKENDLLSAMEAKHVEAMNKIRFAWVDDITGYIQKGLDSQIFDALTGKFKSFKNWWKDFWDSMWKASAQGIARYLSGTLTDTLGNAVKSALAGNSSTSGGVNFGSIANLFGSSSGSTVSSDALAKAQSALATAQTNYDNSFTKDGIALASNADAKTALASAKSSLDALNTASSLNTLYNSATSALSTSISSGFATAGTYAAQGATALGASTSTAAGISNGISGFGYGVANPWSTSSATAGTGTYGTAANIGSGLSAAAISAIGGYIFGTLGDKLFGTQTQAANYAAVGAAVGSLAGPIGAVIGGALGAIIGGMNAKTKVVGGGVDIFGNATADSVSGQDYTSFQKKSWFSNKKWETYSGFSDAEKTAIQKTIGSYDYLLSQMGIASQLTVAGGRYSSIQNFLDTGVVHAFLGATGNDTSAIYTIWSDYAKSINKTIIEAFSSEIGTFITAERTYNEWFAGFGGDSNAALQYKASYLASDFANLESSIGATGLTLANFGAAFDAAVKSNLTPETITNWQNLSTAMMALADAQKAYITSQQNLISGIKSAMNDVDALLNPTVASASTITTAINALITGLPADAANNAKSALDMIKSYQSIINNEVTAANNLKYNMNKLSVSSLSPYTETQQAVYAKDMLQSAITSFQTNYDSASASTIQDYANTYFGLLQKVGTQAQYQSEYDSFMSVINGLKLPDGTDTTSAISKLNTDTTTWLKLIHDDLASKGQQLTVSLNDYANASITGIKITPFAQGGIVNSPTLGLIGEAGYPEAIVPLRDRMSLRTDEMESLLSDIKGILQSIAKSLFAQEDILKKFDYLGMPPVRSAA